MIRSARTTQSLTDYETLRRRRGEVKDSRVCLASRSRHRRCYKGLSPLAVEPGDGLWQLVRSDHYRLRYVLRYVVTYLCQGESVMSGPLQAWTVRSCFVSN